MSKLDAFLKNNSQPSPAIKHTHFTHDSTAKDTHATSNPSHNEVVSHPTATTASSITLKRMPELSMLDIFSFAGTFNELCFSARSSCRRWKDLLKRTRRVTLASSHPNTVHTTFQALGLINVKAPIETGRFSNMKIVNDHLLDFRLSDTPFSTELQDSETLLHCLLDGASRLKVLSIVRPCESLHFGNYQNKNGLTLRELYLTDIEEIHGAIFIAKAAQGDSFTCNIESLTISQCAEVSDEGLLALLSYTNRLKYLDISACPRAGALLLSFLASGNMCGPMRRCAPAEVNIKGCGAFTDEAAVSVVKSIIAMPLANTSLTNAPLSNLKNLSLGASGPLSFGDEGLCSLAPVFASIGLESLVIAFGERVTDAGIQILASALGRATTGKSKSTLKCLEINWCPQITEEGVANLVRLLRPKLTNLSLRHCRRISNALPALLVPLVEVEKRDTLILDLRDTGATSGVCVTLP
eukprot:CAMPEP_0171885278 /NCGR_PEP_ID=MMETSP0992-20121227/41256_1 /TAXON_ID=483369 /ORGANISM="non described non described, Strain CCMP2098" /LENGTH=467 /DNA_ID=CAMNT_0012511807 /DNA_START=49 /DNA_END=1452 /DNA_ORIENTATION=+